MPRRCLARAPGKVILAGEHWVVHGGLSLASSLSVYAEAVCEPRSGGGVVVESALLGAREEVWPPGRCTRLCNLSRSVSRLLELFGGDVAPAVCRIASSIPPGAGLGSSAAVATAFSAAYGCLLAGGPPPRGVVNEAAYEAERVVHGNPSGVDNTVSTYGGFILYRRGLGVRRLNLPPARGAELLIVLSGVARSTRRAVERFTARLRLLGPLSAPLIDVNDSIVALMVQSLLHGDMERVGALMNVSHGLLKGMGVSHRVLDEVVEEAAEAGAYGAKLTGAGMGGAAIVLAPPEAAERLAALLERRGLSVLRAELGVPGVSVEVG